MSRASTCGEDAETLRRSRAGFYPADRPDLLDRYVADALRAGTLAAEGHRVVGAYAMDARITRLNMPVLLIGADHDPYAYPQLERLHARPAARRHGGDRGWHGPAARRLARSSFAEAVAAFLERALVDG